MKVFIIAAQTVDGYIARSRDELADWTSPEDKQLFVRLTKQAGVMVMGSTTFKTIGRALPGRRSIVYSHQPPAAVPENVEYTSEDPAQLLERLAGQGFTEVAICGGKEIYSLFMDAGLIDELYITIEPITFGIGIKLFDTASDHQLSLLDSSLLNDNVMLLHYAVRTPHA